MLIQWLIRVKSKPEKWFEIMIDRCGNYHPPYRCLIVLCIIAYYWIIDKGYA